MGAKQIRISRLFDSKTGRAVNIPVDHGAAIGSVPGLTDPVAVLEKLVKLGIDSTLLNAGLAKITEHLFEGKDAPGRILTADLPFFSCIPGEGGDMIEHDLMVPVEVALRGNFDAMKVILAWGLDRDVQIKNIRIVANLAAECDRWNIPLMVEPVLWGTGIPKEKKKDPALIEHAARIGLEIGADILKMPYTGDVKGFAELVRQFRVPVMVLGGPKMDSIRDVFEVASGSVQAGGRGVVFGRNVWQHPKMDKVIKALQDIVHRDATVDSVMSKYGL